MINEFDFDTFLSSDDSVAMFVCGMCTSIVVKLNTNLKTFIVSKKCRIANSNTPLFQTGSKAFRGMKRHSKELLSHRIHFEMTLM